MKTESPATIYLKNYEKPTYEVGDVYLTFNLDDTKTRVTSVMTLRRNPEVKTEDIELDGENLKLISVKINDEKVDETGYELSEGKLKIFKVPNSLTLEIETEISPATNKSLEGLYKSGDILCTQNEAEGFRRITYYFDRPDVMATFKTKIIADKKTYPILLSNGNPTDKGELEDGKHWIEWEDPFKKPCYLYALVAGDLGMIEDHFTTMSGRKILLQIYCDKGNEDKCFHAMRSLQKSMKWDEERFGLEYDLDIYMIVAVDAFNMGAMENKGLNIFNSSCALAHPKTATDYDFLRVEGVIGHEYFHNWTGNRITCRDWFQLTLKEGLTVFRDQEFSGDMNNHVIQRISDVQRLRSYQFPEDASAMSHPIKPSEYMTIDNFYTATIYEKGAEVIRMVHTILGEEGFRKGMDEYFKLFDGQAVRTEDFIHAMSVANNNYDFTQFIKWYSQSGTPSLEVEHSYNKDTREFSIEITQSEKGNQELQIPFKLGLVKSDGSDEQLILRDRKDQPDIERGLVHLKKKTEKFIFKDVDTVIPSFNRDFSAPVRLISSLNIDEWAFLMGNDNNTFNRIEAHQKMIIETIDNLLKGEKISINYLDSYKKIVDDHSLENSVKAELMNITSEVILHQKYNPIPFNEISAARKQILKEVASQNEEALKDIYLKNTGVGHYDLNPESMGKRSLANTCLSLLMILGKQEYISMAYEQMNSADNMTDEFAGFSCLLKVDCPEREKALTAFYNKWKHEPLIMQKWISAQTASPLDYSFESFTDLEQNAVFDKTVPNFSRALVGGFISNYTQFNHKSGRGYKLLADKILDYDKFNPQLASRLGSGFKSYQKLPDDLKGLMKGELGRILADKSLSKNCYEIISKTLGS